VKQSMHTLELDALQRAQTTRIARRIARSMGQLFLFLLIFLALTPWQQNVRGVGRVVAYSPNERQQLVGAPVEGRINYWRVQEGSHVWKGDVIAELSDNDPLILQRLHAEYEAATAKQTATDDRVATFREQLRMAELARPQALAAAESRVDMARERLKAAQQVLDAAKAARLAASLNIDRQQHLEGKGLASRRTLELAQLDIAQRQADAERAIATLKAATSEVDAITADWRKLDADTTASIQKAQAELNKSIEDQNYVRGDVLKLETRLARQQTQIITAPRDGVIKRLLANPGAELVKSGQALAILVPDTEERAVELWMDGNDLPLIVNDRHVRLQFEGYPAIQFGGWPRFSVGSFGGRVTIIDATDDGHGVFRIVVQPDPDDIPWPEPRFLRQGVRVNGWVILGRVTLGYELWRIFNGFPPLILPESDQEPTAKIDGKAKDSDKGNDYGGY